MASFRSESTCARQVRKLEKNIEFTTEGLETLFNALPGDDFDPYTLAAYRRCEALLTVWDKFLPLFRGFAVYKPKGAGWAWWFKALRYYSSRIRNLVERALKKPELNRLADLGIHRRHVVDHFATVFCDWYAQRTGYAKPRVKVWVNTNFEKFEIVNVLLKKGCDSGHEYQNGSLGVSDKNVFGCAWTVTRINANINPVLRAVDRRLIVPLFKNAETAIFLFVEHAFSVVRRRSRDSFLKVILVHELLHAFEQKNNIIIIKSENKEELVEATLLKFLEENPSCFKKFRVGK